MNSNKKLYKLGTLALLSGVCFSSSLLADDSLKMNVGGYVKADFTSTSNGLNGVHDATGIYNFELTSINEDLGRRFDTSAKQTTLNFTAVKDDPNLGKIKAFVEGNFYGEGSFGGIEEASGFNSYDFILRHAYIEVGGFVIGQTWSTFTDLNGLPRMNDFALPTGSVWSRASQIRYSKKMDSITVMVSAENPSLDIDFADVDEQSSPDFVARVDWDPSWGHFSLAAISRKLEAEQTVDDSKSGSGYAFTTKIPIGDNLSIMGQYASGELGFYAAFTAYGDANIVGGELDPIEFDAWTIAASVQWSDKLSSNFIYSESEADEPGQNAGAHNTDETESFHANLYYDMSKNLSVSFEYQTREAVRATDKDEREVERYGIAVTYAF